MTAPEYGGEAVRHVESGRIGITTSAPKERAGTIGVQYLGAPYDVRVAVDELTVIGLAEVTA